MRSPSARLNLIDDVGDLNHESGAAGQPRCDYCRDVIGVYEPLILVRGGGNCETSRAAEPHLSLGSADACYHGGCYELRSGGGAPGI